MTIFYYQYKKGPMVEIDSYISSDELESLAEEIAKAIFESGEGEYLLDEDQIQFDLFDENKNKLGRASVLLEVPEPRFFGRVTK